MIKKKSFSLIIIGLLISVLLFFPSFVNAKDLVYEADISPTDPVSGERMMTFRKYVKKFGGEKNTDWSYPGTLLKNQSTSQNGSYVTIAMLFHKTYGTNYQTGERSRDLLEVAYDTNPNTNRISTDQTHDNAEAFFKDYNISGSNTTKIDLFSESNKYSFGKIYESGDIEVWRQKYLGHIAVTDFRIKGTQYDELINNIENNLSKESDGKYKLYVSGRLKVIGSNADATKNKTYTVDTAQELYDIMIPSGAQAYDLRSSNTTINSVWDSKNFGYTQITNWNTASMFARGHSALNNFDNILYVTADKR